MASKLVWTNSKRQYKGQKCKGSYKVVGKKRSFLLVDGVKKLKHRFGSHEEAKTNGWKTN